MPSLEHLPHWEILFINSLLLLLTTDPLNAPPPPRTLTADFRKLAKSRTTQKKPPGSDVLSHDHVMCQQLAIASARGKFKFKIILAKMSSFERSRSSAYGEDLRWRMVWQCEAMGKPVEEVAYNLCVDKSTVYRVLQIFYQTGGVKKKVYPKECSYRKITTPAQLFIMHLVIEKPGEAM